ncbi:Uncharacterized protein Rs2_29286 [Raphanus sativus]|nr:Uncharacterized protein Rs2_29286 [Raphanus sativus]
MVLFSRLGGNGAGGLGFGDGVGGLGFGDGVGGGTGFGAGLGGLGGGGLALVMEQVLVVALGAVLVVEVGMETGQVLVVLWLRLRWYWWTMEMDQGLVVVFWLRLRWYWWTCRWTGAGGGFG